MTKKDGVAAFGFLTVVQHKQLGAFGGYLLLNKSGRPLEFHCTAPVKANRAQEILYGSTLPDYLYGEVIGQTLVEKSAVKPVVICTDRSALLTVRPFVDVPVIRVFKSTAAQSEEPLDESAAETAAPAAGELAFQVSFNRFVCLSEFAADRETAVERMRDLAGKFDLSEPFARIREAIKEAQQGKAA